MGDHNIWLRRVRELNPQVPDVVETLPITLNSSAHKGKF